MPALPLARFELFVSADLDAVRELVGRVLVPHRLSLVGASTRLDARMHTRRIVRVAANYLSYGGEVLFEAGEFGSFFVVQIPLAGHCTVRLGDDEIFSTPGLASVVSPGRPLRMRLSAGCAMLILRLERPALEAHLRDLLGVSLSEPLCFELGMDISVGYGRSWAAAFRLLVDELDHQDGSMINNRAAAAEFEDGLMTGLLLAQPHNYTAMLDETAHSAVPHRAVTITRELVENHPEWRHTVRSLAQEASVGVRTLQKAFATHLGTPPKEYLTSVRMQRAHDELLAAQPDAVTVGQVVAKWGLGHPGRFANAYRRRFGELPSETLRK